MIRARLLATLIAVALATVVYVAAHRLVRPSVGADIAIMGAVIFILALLPGYLAKWIKRRACPADHSSRDLPVS